MADTREVEIAHASFWYVSDDRSRVAFRGETVEVNAEDYERGMKHDAFVVAKSEPAKPATIEEILAEVGEDQEKAAAALQEEQAKGDKARSTLVEKLESIANPPA